MGNTAIQRVSKDLGLPRGAPYTQDWVYELPSEFRSYLWFRRYADAYREHGYGDDEKRLLIEIMFDVANDLLENKDPMAEAACSEIGGLIAVDPDLHRDRVKYWAVIGHALDDAFAISPYAREILRTTYGE